VDTEIEESIDGTWNNNFANLLEVPMHFVAGNTLKFASMKTASDN